MKHLHLLPIGPVDMRLLEWLGQALYNKFRMPAEILLPPLDPAFALHAERQQYHSSELLACMQRSINFDTWRILGITQLDLYIPILTFVFGEAQLRGKAAVVSYHRLQQEFYGLPAQQDLLRERTVKEVLHELGHTFGLTHCSDSKCAMSLATHIELVDAKAEQYCARCGTQLVKRFASKEGKV